MIVFYSTLKRFTVVTHVVNQSTMAVLAVHLVEANAAAEM
jgi:hypothetical protein